MKRTFHLSMLATALALLLGITQFANAALVGHYALDAMAGGTTPDSTGINGDGVVTGAGITQVAGVVGNAFDFSGGNGQFVGINDATFGKSAFTASVWFNPDSLGSQGPLSNWTNAGPSPRSHLIRSNGASLQTFVRSGGAQTGGTVTFASEALTASGFNHAVITYDGQNLRTYLNGELSGTVNSFAAPAIIGDGVLGTAAIGGRGSSEFDMVGLVDDVAYWDETLTSGKVAAVSNLARNATLNYDASEVNQLFQVFDGAAPNAQIGNLTWQSATGLGGSAGELVDLGEGHVFLNLDGTAGVTTLGGFSLPVPVAQFDVNLNASPTQAGFLALSNNPPSGTQNGITLSASSGLDEFRDRNGTGNLAGHPLADLLRDFAFENDASSVTFDLDGLDANSEYELTIFGYDRGGNNGSTVDWYQDAIAGSPLATHVLNSAFPDDADFKFNVMSDAFGHVTLVADIQSGILVFNGLVVSQSIAPIPEPTTGLLALLGIGGLAARRRRQAA